MLYQQLREPVGAEREAVDWLTIARLLRAVYGLNLMELTTYEAMFYVSGLGKVVELTGRSL